MRVGIVGSRIFNDYDKFFIELENIIKDYVVSEIISGGARGADTFAEIYVDNNRINKKVFKPDWAIGKHAALLRNTTIVENYDIIIAFWDGVSKGTLDSINKAEKIK